MDKKNFLVEADGIKYVAPQIDVVEVMVERGFASSLDEPEEVPI
jgi:hypothetical protein